MTDDKVQPFDISDMWESEVNEEQRQKIEKDLLPAPGKYRTVPPLAFEGKRVKHDSYPDGRPLARAFVKLESKDGRKEAIGLTLALEAPAKGESGRWDGPSKLWLNAVGLAKTAGVYDGSIRSVISFLQDYPVGLSIRHATFEDEGRTVAFVGGLSQPPEEE